MFFLIDDARAICFHVPVRSDIYGSITSYFTKVCKAAPMKAIGWDTIKEPGYFYTKVDDLYELRHYYETVGYVYNCLYYDVMGTFKIAEYDFKTEKAPTYLDLVKRGKAKRPATPRAKTTV
jgi:hypothetical protein